MSGSEYSLRRGVSRTGDVGWVIEGPAAGGWHADGAAPWAAAKRWGGNYYNSGVTRESSNTGHMGFTTKGLWVNVHGLQPRGEVCSMILLPDLLQSQSTDRWFCQPRGRRQVTCWWVQDQPELWERKRLCACRTVSSGLPDWFSRNQIRLRSSNEA